MPSTLTRPIAVRVPNQQADAIHNLAAAHGVTVADLLRLLVDRSLQALTPRGGWSPRYLAEQLVDLIEAEVVDFDDPGTREQLNRLRKRLENLSYLLEPEVATA